MEAQVILKATNVDGVYTADPNKDATPSSCRPSHFKKRSSKATQ